MGSFTNSNLTAEGINQDLGEVVAQGGSTVVARYSLQAEELSSTIFSPSILQ